MRSYTPVVPLTTTPDSRKKLSKVYTRHQTKTAKKTLPFRTTHTEMAYIGEYPHHLPLGQKCEYSKYESNPGGVRTTIAKHHGRYSKSDHLCQDGVE